MAWHDWSSRFLADQILAIMKLTHSQKRHKLRKSDEQEEQIEEELEFIVEHYWNEGEDWVFLVVHLVGKVVSRLRSAVEPQSSFLHEYFRGMMVTYFFWDGHSQISLHLVHAAQSPLNRKLTTKFRVFIIIIIIMRILPALLHLHRSIRQIKHSILMITWWSFWMRGCRYDFSWSLFAKVRITSLGPPMFTLAFTFLFCFLL